LLLQPIYPIASNQYRLHGQEEKALALCMNFPELYKYLIDQPNNSIEKAKNNKPTMVRAMALLRNILAHEQSKEWKDLRGVAQKVIEHMGGRNRVQEVFALFLSQIPA